MEAASEGAAQRVGVLGYAHVEVLGEAVRFGPLRLVEAQYTALMRLRKGLPPARGVRGKPVDGAARSTPDCKL